ncbi:ribosome-associated protein [Nitrosospira multiformis]|uniref:Dual-action ribosomal maturation protein DarP n=1 Tax=Nitrosospira multiformis TaxID=1231 RepID=A0A2T5IC00_9PROT|nr:ribosome biogenesis factor YjgA [Nitrosospira multiformis]PTQ81356.1 ribosome-associated protein [Nitrosospira multiformis]
MEENLADNSEREARPSKTKRKKEMHALQDIGESLVQLDSKRLIELGLSDTLMEAVLEAKRIRKHGALRRQMQLIGKLMRDVDAELIRKKLDLWGNPSAESTARLHQLERWRERLMADEQMQALNELGQKYPTADLQQLRTLARNAAKEKLANKAPKSFRALFHELQKIIPATDERRSEGID